MQQLLWHILSMQMCMQSSSDSSGISAAAAAAAGTTADVHCKCHLSERLRALATCVLHDECVPCLWLCGLQTRLLEMLAATLRKQHAQPHLHPQQPAAQATAMAMVRPWQWWGQ